MKAIQHIASPVRAMLLRPLLAACLGVALACTGGWAEAKTKHSHAKHQKVAHKVARHKATPVVLSSNGAASASQATAASNERLVTEFSPFVGSKGDAESLVATLRSGRATSESGPAGQAPATGPMGYGEVRLALKLAQGALKQQGITAPNPDQLSAALHGGKVVTVQGEQALPGVLPQRHQGAGWAAMAQEYGLSAEDMMPPPHMAAHKAAKAQAHGKAAKGSKAAKGGKASKASKFGGKSGARAKAPVKKKHA